MPHDDIKLGGLDMNIGKTSKYIKIDLYMAIPTHSLWVMKSLTTFILGIFWHSSSKVPETELKPIPNSNSLSRQWCKIIALFIYLVMKIVP